MRLRLALLVVVAGCSFGVDTYSSPPPDARPIDVSVYYPWPDPNCPQGVPVVSVSCSQSTARTQKARYYMGAGSHSNCGFIEQQDMTTCAQGCALTVNDYQLQGAAPDLLVFTGAARVLCAELAEAQIGDACDASGTKPCLPTRAVLANDGTVASMTYLTCGTSGRCEATNAPTLPNYLEACDATTVSTFGTPNANGYAYVAGRTACLIASNGGPAASGLTQFCVGDWQCPTGSLCDDQLTSLLAGYTAKGVCKPGPRGVLTPAMLAP